MLCFVMLLRGLLRSLLLPCVCCLLPEIMVLADGEFVNSFNLQLKMNFLFYLMKVSFCLLFVLLSFKTSNDQFSFQG